MKLQQFNKSFKMHSNKLKQRLCSTEVYCLNYNMGENYVIFL